MAQCGCLLITRYYEAAGFGKALTLRNACGASSNTTNLDLANDYSLIACVNGGCESDADAQVHSFSPNATLSPNQTWTVAHPSAILPAGVPPPNQTDAALQFNGDDAWGVRHNPTGTLVDSVGLFGVDPGTAWDVAGTVGATKDHTLLRKPSVTGGNCGNWPQSAVGESADASQWTVEPMGSWWIDDVGDVNDDSGSGEGNGSGEDSGEDIGSGEGAGDDDCPLKTTDCRGADESEPTDRRLDAKRLVIATFNAEWLFDGRCDPSASPWAQGSEDCAGLGSGLNQCDATGAEAHLQRVAAQMRALEADVINVAEVESCQMLSQCAAALNQNGTLSPGLAAHPAFEHFMLPGTDTFTRQQVGLLTRLSPLRPLERTSARESYPLNSSGCGALSTPRSSGISKHYMARLRLDLPGKPGATLAVLGLHLKAFPTTPSACHQREAQAAVAASLLAQALNETDYVVALGDMNDFDGDECCLDAKNSTPTSRVLRMLKNPRSVDQDELHSVAERIPHAERYTSWWDHKPKDGVDQGLEEHSSIDHILDSIASQISGVEASDVAVTVTPASVLIEIGISVANDEAAATVAQQVAAQLESAAAATALITSQLDGAPAASIAVTEIEAMPTWGGEAASAGFWSQFGVGVGIVLALLCGTFIAHTLWRHYSQRRGGLWKPHSSRRNFARAGGEYDSSYGGFFSAAEVSVVEMSGGSPMRRASSTYPRPRTSYV